MWVEDSSKFGTFLNKEILSETQRLAEPASGKVSLILIFMSINLEHLKN